MGDAKRRGTRDERIAQAQRIAVMTIPEARTLEHSAAAHAAKARIGQIERDEYLARLRASNRGRRAQRAALIATVMAAAVGSLPSQMLRTEDLP